MSLDYVNDICLKMFRVGIVCAFCVWWCSGAPANGTDATITTIFSDLTNYTNKCPFLKNSTLVSARPEYLIKCDNVSYSQTVKINERSPERLCLGVLEMEKRVCDHLVNATNFGNYTNEFTNATALTSAFEKDDVCTKLKTVEILKTIVPHLNDPVWCYQNCFLQDDDGVANPPCQLLWFLYNYTLKNPSVQTVISKDVKNELTHSNEPAHELVKQDNKTDDQKPKNISVAQNSALVDIKNLPVTPVVPKPSIASTSEAPKKGPQISNPQQPDETDPNDEAKQPEYEDSDGPLDIDLDNRAPQKELTVPVKSETNDFEDHVSRQVVQPKFVENEDSNFFVYFMFISAVFILGYVAYHNKQKVFALLLEGRRNGNRRRPNTASYRKLDSNLEEAMTSAGTTTFTPVIY